jgi:hypothetical protein
MYRTVSSRLTAHFNKDGGHLQRYLERKPQIVQSLCEDLILHDQVLIRTQDYLTACGLILIIGEKGFIDLLERDKLKFIRTRGVCGLISGKGPAEIGIVYATRSEHPSVAPIEESVQAGLRVIEDRINDKNKLQQVIVQNSIPIEWDIILKAVNRESIEDLRYTKVWEPQHESNNPDFFVLPKTKNINIRIIGPGFQPKNDIQDAALALILYNSDLYLAEKFDCNDISPFYSIGDLLDIKQKRLSRHTGYSDKLWTLLEIAGVPDFSQVELSEASHMSDLLKVSTSKNAKQFRDWFHPNASLDEKEILREYLGVVQQVPWVQKLPAKGLRFAATTALGFFPGLGQAASFFDTFIVERLFKGKSPKFFVDDLTKIWGDLKLK